MYTENLKIRLYRALSGLTQEKFCQEIGMDAGTYAGLELGLTRPGPDKLERAARVIGVGPDFGDEVLELLDLRRRKRLRVGRAVDDLAADFAETARSLFIRTHERLLALQPPVMTPREEDRRQAREQLPRLLALTPSQRAAVVNLGDGEYHAWALALEAGDAALAAADPEEALRLASIAVELAGQVEGRQGWPEAVRGRALESLGIAQQRLGREEEARKSFEEASRLGEAGSDPYGALEE